MKKQEEYIERCLTLALAGLGKAAPNPLVGCVIVADDKIIGEGYHREYGKAHAEVNAINNVADVELLKKSTLFVNLEPCSHYGKTPPCADLIIAKGIPEVVIGTTDPNPLVAGKGIEKLRANGVKVTENVLHEACRFLNRRFFTYFEKKRPYVILKWAQTRDGYIDIVRNHNLRQPTWITGEHLRTIVHKWRSEEQAIMVGKNTALLDNPKLNVRSWTGKNPLRIVIDKNCELPQNLNLFDATQPTLIFNNLKNQSLSTNIEYIKIDFSDSIFPQILELLYNRKIQSLIVEGGRQLLQSIIDEGLWDEARVLTGNKFFCNGLTAPLLRQNPNKTEYFNEETIDFYYNLSL